MMGIPDYVRGVLHTLEEAGYQAYLVGGCLRDMLLGRVIHDWDVATTARGAEVASLFRKTVETGARFGTVTVVTEDGHVEVTTLRSDGVYSDHRRPEVVRFVDDLQEDLKRRDFTINAMAMSSAGVLSDPFDGQGDLKRRLLRCVGNAADRFSEDALRIFRALRFSAQLGFDIEDQTMAAIGKCAPLCAQLSAERVRDETEKILMSSRPELIGAAVECGLYAGRLLTTGSSPEALRGIAALPDDRYLRWAALCAVLFAAGYIESTGGFLNSMRLDAKAVHNCGAGATAALNAFPTYKRAIKHLLSTLGLDAGLCAAAADAVLRGSDALRCMWEVISSRECFSLDALAISGDDLIAMGVAPGVQLGAILKALLAHVIDHAEDNEREILMKTALIIMKETGI